jgi:CDP-diacylglycerol--glycerol-3-phosphate 3-phosphatidyltransferase
MKGMLKHVPNLITAARVGCFPVLVVLAAQGREEPFQWLLLVAMCSDILDGVIARHFGLASPLGALLDTVADLLTTGATVFGLWCLRPEFLRDYGGWLVLLLGAWAVQVAASFWRYGHLSSFHTWLARLSAYPLGIFVMVLFIWDFKGWLFALAIGTSLLACLEEILLVWLLPQWSADVRGAWWVLRARRDK